MKNKEKVTDFVKPEVMSDLIYFSIKATRAKGKEKIKVLRQLKRLIQAEIEYQKAKQDSLDN